MLDHHRQIEAAFGAVIAAADAASRLSAQKRLAVLLTGHAIAEEAVLYPALVKANEDGHSTKAYTEQAAAKVQMGLLENLQPMSQEYLDKLEQEGGNWFLDLKEKLPAADQVKLTFRYQEEFLRYTHGASEEPDAPKGALQERLANRLSGSDPMI